MDEIHAHAASTALAKAERIRTTDERALLEAKLDFQRRMYLTKSSLCSTGSRVVTALTNRGEATVRLRPLPLASCDRTSVVVLPEVRAPTRKDGAAGSPVNERRAVS